VRPHLIVAMPVAHTLMCLDAAHATATTPLGRTGPADVGGSHKRTRGQHGCGLVDTKRGVAQAEAEGRVKCPVGEWTGALARGNAPTAVAVDWDTSAAAATATAAAPDSKSPAAAAAPVVRVFVADQVPSELPPVPFRNRLLVVELSLSCSHCMYRTTRAFVW
jgi:hypothetical protein